MSEFSDWAHEAGEEIAKTLGTGNIDETITADIATWTFGTNTATAKLRGPGEPHIDMTYTRGGTGAEWFLVGANPTSAGAQIAGALSGK